MKKNYTKPAIGMQSIEPCAIMAGSGTDNPNIPERLTTVTVGNMAGRQIQETGIFNGGTDATDDVTPTSKEHSMWDDWE